MIYKNFIEHDGVQLYELGYAPFGMRELLWTVYFFKIGDTLIDTGSKNTRKGLPKFQLGDINQVFLTHFHEDHSGNAAYFKDKFQVPIYAHALSEPFLKNGFPIQMYEKIMFGAIEPFQPNRFPTKIKMGNWDAEVIHVPGHSVDHCCYFIPEKGFLFSGDLYVADKIKIWRKSESLHQQINSLERLLQLDFDVLFCSHNPRLENGKYHLRNKYEFLMDFRERVQQFGDIPALEIMSNLKLKEKQFEKWISWKDVSVVNLVEAAKAPL